MIKVDIKQYMAMLSSFTECAQYRSECYRLEAENEKLRSKLLDSLKVSRSPRNVEQVKKMYFAQFDEITWYIEHDKFKINSIRRCLKENEKCYLGNLLETAKRYFSGSLRDFQKCGINTDEIKKEWEKVIDEIRKQIINN